MPTPKKWKQEEKVMKAEERGRVSEGPPPTPVRRELTETAGIIVHTGVCVPPKNMRKQVCLQGIGGTILENSTEETYCWHKHPTLRYAKQPPGRKVEAHWAQAGAP